MKVPLKIAMVAACPFPYPRGTPIRILRMAETIAELGCDVHVITYHLGQKVKSINFTIHRIPNFAFYKKVSPGPSYLKLLILNPFLTFNLTRLHWKYRFDIIHAHHFEGLMTSWPIRLFGNTPIVFDAHTLLQTELHHYNLYLNKSLLKKLGKILDRYLPKAADYVISVSEQIHSQLIKDAKISPEVVSKILNGIELENFSKIRSTRKFDGSDEIIIGFSGNFACYQGIDIMIESISLIKKTYPKIKLYIYSNDSIESYFPLICRLNLSNRIKVFPTNFQVLPIQLSKADILLNPRPDGAGIPMKLINYMAVGKPIVSFAGSDQIIQHGKTGWVVRNKSPQSFSAGISYLLNNRELAEEMGINARNYIRQNFSWHLRGKEIIKIYQKLLSKE
jgi:glycosyltransferase involved in cell wall biosynthesis